MSLELITKEIEDIKAGFQAKVSAAASEAAKTEVEKQLKAVNEKLNKNPAKKMLHLVMPWVKSLKNQKKSWPNTKGIGTPSTLN